MLQLAKRLCLALVFFIGAGAAQAQTADLLISEYVEGSSNNKALEFYNGTGSAIDLTAGAYSVQFFFNGNTSAGLTINLTGTVASGDVFVLAQSSANATILAVADQTNSGSWYNGDDAIVLRKNGVVIDSLGQVGTDPGSQWGSGNQSTADNTLRRMANVCAGDTITNDAFDPATQWDGFAQDTFDGLGAHTANCASGPTLSIDDVTVVEGDSGTTDAVFTVSLSTPAPAGGISFDYATADDAATAGSDYTATSGIGTIAAGTSSTTITVPVLGDTALEINETFLVRLSNPSAGASIGDGEGLGTITNDDVVISQIHDVQGNGDTSPVDGNLVMVEAVVTAKRGNGFFVQEPDADYDADPATSEGIFVFTSIAPDAVAVGDMVRVTATVDEFFGSSEMPTTELVSPDVVVLTSNNPLPSAVEITAAMAGSNSTPSTLEPLEGMRVTVANGVVTAQNEGRIDSETNATSSDGNNAFEFVVAGVERPFREPGISIFDPFPVPPAKQATIPYFDANQERIKAYPLLGTRLVADAGATVTGLAGVLTYYGDSWELLYDVANPPVIGSATATAVSDASADDITVGGFNLLRFFDTVDDGSGPELTATAFANRLAKTGAAICDWVKAPDILGVVEVENLATLTELANYINGNCPSAPAYQPYLIEGNDVGGIDVGFLVSTRAVKAGVSRVAVTSVVQYGKDTLYGSSPVGCTPGTAGCTSDLLNDRPPLVLRGTVNFADGRTYPLTVIVNHLRSLNGNDDPEDNRVRYKRAEQAVALAKLVDDLQTANPGEKIVLVGDFNAFPFNDGYVDVMGIVTGNPAAEDQVIEYRDSPLAIPMVLGDELIADPLQRYSYVFDGNAQTLDHAVVNSALVNDPAVAALTVEHARINADFLVSHYGEFDPPYTAANPPLRVSDHDPVRLAIRVVRPASADLALAWTTRHFSTRGVFTTLTVRNGGSASISGAQVRIDLEIPPKSNAGIGAPSGWTCDRIDADSFVCTASIALHPGSIQSFSVSVKPNVRFASTDTFRFEAQATVISDPISGDNSASLVLP